MQNKQEKTPSAPRTVLITGGAVRIGAALSRAFAAAGWRVAVHFHQSRSAAEALCAELGPAHGLFQADLTAEEQRDGLIPAVLERFGRLDCLVNNASRYVRKGFLALDETAFFEAYRLNCLAPLALSQQFIRLAGGGSIINLLDCRVAGVDADGGAYLLAKKTLRDITEALALAAAPAVRVNAIAPGVVLSPPGVPPEKISRLLAYSPMRQANQLEELGRACLLLAESPTLTGEILHLDGGMHLNRLDWQEPRQ